jgi:hypothetical protein
MLIPFGVLSAAAGGGVAGGNFDLIASEILTTSEASITFSNLGDYSSTYKHLQIRFAARSARSAQSDSLGIRFNGDSGSNYSQHQMEGNGSNVASYATTSQTLIALNSSVPAAELDSNIFGSAVIDLLDVYSTSKNTTTRALTGLTGLPRINLQSGAYLNTAAISSIVINSTSASNLTAGSRFSLYGIKG